MKNRQFIRVLMITATSSLMAGFDAYAEIASGNDCGEDCSWVISDDGVLTISGTGSITKDRGLIYDEEYDEYYPEYSISDYSWSAYVSDVKKIDINEGITSIQGGSFDGMDNVTEMIIPNPITEYEPHSFHSFPNLKDLTIGDNFQLFQDGEGWEWSWSSFNEDNWICDAWTCGYRDTVRAYFDAHPELTDPNSEHYNEKVYIPWVVDGLFGGDWNQVTIHCSGDLAKCQQNAELYGYLEGGYNNNSLNIIQATPKSSNTEIKNADGSFTIYDKDGNIIGYKNKRIYTLDEANAVAGTANHVKIRYR